MARPGSGVAFVSMLVAPGGTAFRRHTRTVFLDVSVIQQHAAMRRRLSKTHFPPYSVTRAWVGMRTPSWLSHTACVLNPHLFSRHIFRVCTDHEYSSSFPPFRFSQFLQKDVFFFFFLAVFCELTKRSSSCLMTRAPSVSFSPVEWLCSCVSVSFFLLLPPVSVLSLQQHLSPAVCSLACWPLSATADKIWHLV